MSIELEFIRKVEAYASSTAIQSADHGPRHWRDVARVGHMLWAEGVDVDPMVMLFFAVLHDSQRLSEFEDPEHGIRAATAAHTLSELEGWPLSKDQTDTLVVALMFHGDGGVSPGVSVGACWDADRITLPRVGIAPDPRFFSSEIARERFDGLAIRTGSILSGPDAQWDSIVAAYKSETPLDVLVDGPSAPQDGWTRGYAMMRRMFRGGELVPELQACVREIASMTWICHPLIHSPYFSMEASRMNDLLSAKRQELQQLEGESKYHAWVFMHERPYRFRAMNDARELFSLEADAWAELVSDVWSDSENIWQNRQGWELVLMDLDYGALCDDDELAELADLPEVLWVYRGTCAPDAIGSGMSWTLNEGRAAWFAIRLHMDDRHEQPTVIVGRIQKTEVLGYLTGRGEDEIVALEDSVAVLRTYEVPLPPTAGSDLAREIMNGNASA